MKKKKKKKKKNTCSIAKAEFWAPCSRCVNDSGWRSFFMTWKYWLTFLCNCTMITS